MKVSESLLPVELSEDHRTRRGTGKDLGVTGFSSIHIS